MDTRAHTQVCTVMPSTQLLWTRRNLGSRYGGTEASQAARLQVGCGPGTPKTGSEGRPWEWIPTWSLFRCLSAANNKQHAIPHSHLIFLPGSVYFPEVNNNKNRDENQPCGQNPSSAHVTGVLVQDNLSQLTDSSSQMSPGTASHSVFILYLLSQDPCHSPP